MDFTADIFLNLITMLLHRPNDHVESIANEIVDRYGREKFKNATVGTDELDMYCQIVSELISNRITIQDTREVATLLAKYRDAKVVTDNPEVYSRLKVVMTDAAEVTDERYQITMSQLANSLAISEANATCRKIFATLLSANENKTVESQQQILHRVSDMAGDIIKQVESASSIAHEEEDNDEVRVKNVDLADRDSLSRAIKAHRILAVENKFRTGLQGLNRALGGGFKCGESICFNSLSHNGKTMSLLKMVRWQIMLNRVGDRFKNPTVLLYSLENESPQNIMLLYHEIYVNMFNRCPDPSMTDDQVVDTIFEQLNSTGWRLIIQRRLGAEFGYQELIADFEAKERMGLTPIMCVIDYMNLMKKGHGGNDDSGANHLAIGELYSNVCNYMRSKNCTLVTAHQLNRKAAEVARVVKSGAVKHFDSGMLAGSMDPQREVDVVIYQHKEYDLHQRAYMTYKLDKHRYEHSVPDSDRYFAYMFDGELGILDDVDGPDRSIKNIHANPIDGEPSDRDDEDPIL